MKLGPEIQALSQAKVTSYSQLDQTPGQGVSDGVLETPFLPRVKLAECRVALAGQEVKGSTPVRCSHPRWGPRLGEPAVSQGPWGTPACPHAQQQEEGKSQVSQRPLPQSKQIDLSLCLTLAKGTLVKYQGGGQARADGRDAWVLAPALSWTCPVTLGRPLSPPGSDSATK